MLEWKHTYWCFIQTVCPRACMWPTGTKKLPHTHTSPTITGKQETMSSVPHGSINCKVLSLQLENKIHTRRSFCSADLRRSISAGERCSNSQLSLHLCRRAQILHWRSTRETGSYKDDEEEEGNFGGIKGGWLKGRASTMQWECGREGERFRGVCLWMCASAWGKQTARVEFKSLITAACQKPMSRWWEWVTRDFIHTTPCYACVCVVQC